MKNLFVLVLLIFSFSAKAGDDWVKKNPAGDLPLARFGHALAYIGDDKILCYGGNGGYPGPYAHDTWLYDYSDSSWTNLNPDPFPPIRRDHAMAYIGEGKVLMFGGYYPGYIGETWLYTLNTNKWTQLTPAQSPGDRYSHAMCYIGDDKVLIHGGVGDPGYMDDMWVFDLSDSSWTKITPTGAKPSPRHYHKIAKISDDKLILYGGYDTATVKKDTWIYELSSNQWTELSPLVNPLQRYMHSLVSIGDNKVMLFGGKKGVSIMNETWVFDLDDITWTKDLNTTNPPGLYQHMMCETCLDGLQCVILFGGATSSNDMNETWTFGGGDYITDVKADYIHPPASFSLMQNYPNPFNPLTNIIYTIPEQSRVMLKIYGVAGNEIDILVDDEKSAGTYEIKWNADDLPGGVYFCRFTAGKFSAVQKMILLK